MSIQAIAEKATFRPSSWTDIHPAEFRTIIKLVPSFAHFPGFYAVLPLASYEASLLKYRS